MPESSFSRGEAIISARSLDATGVGPGGVKLYTLVSEECGATTFSSGIARFSPGSVLPYHLHGFSEAVTVVEGRARILVEGRVYLLDQYDCVHLPAGVAHQVENGASAGDLVAHWAFATARPTRELVDKVFPKDDRGTANPNASDPETIVRYKADEAYELSDKAIFMDLFAGRFGSVGICGGYGRFLEGASLPCHTHHFDESITIITGTAVCLVQGKSYELSGCDTAFIPKGVPHRFLNQSSREMSMIWLYAGSEPERSIVDSGFCSGERPWSGADLLDE